MAIVHVKTGNDCETYILHNMHDQSFTFTMQYNIHQCAFCVFSSIAKIVFILFIAY